MTSRTKIPTFSNQPGMPLGRPVLHSRTYDPGQLCPIARSEGRNAEGLSNETFLHCFGEDIWNIYELSWLDKNGKPDVAMAEIRVPLQSPNLIESKSLKLYLSSLNMTVFNDPAALRDTITDDFSNAAGQPVQVRLIASGDFRRCTLSDPDGLCIDDKDIEAYTGKIEASGLRTSATVVREVLFSRLFRSVCPVTGQPDYATVMIRYEGEQICRRSLLSYLVSFREHAGFHEACVERIFHDLLHRCRPGSLVVSARFMRRGGIDINPFRATDEVHLANLRDPRQ